MIADDFWKKDHRLCYISGAFAYFTNKPLNEQWGDDWNDAPYEHNAGQPYSDGPGQIEVVAWSGPFDTPDEGHHNSPWSVEQINAGAVAWLRTGRWALPNAPAIVSIMAGATIDEFCYLIESGGGSAFLRRRKTA